MKSKELIGEYIKNLREENCMTQLDLAKILHVEPQTISKWENGNGYPDLSLLDQMANYFEITVDDILECRNNENRNTIANKQEYFKNISNKLYNFFKFNYDSNNSEFIEYYPENWKKNFRIDKKEVFMLLENKIWIYDKDKKIFIEPKTKISFDQIIIKEIILFYGIYEEDRFKIFLLEQFETKMSIEFIETLLKKDKYLLTKYFVSFVGPFKQYYPNENIPILEDVPHKIHPQIEEMRNIYCKNVHEDLFEEQNLKIILKALNLPTLYSFDLFSNIYYDKYKISSKLFNIIKSNFQIKPTISLNEKGNQLLYNLCIDDSYKVIDYIMEFFNVPDLRKVLLFYIDKMLNTKKTETIKKSINLYLKYWTLNKNDLINVLYKTTNHEYISMFIDEFGCYPSDVEILINYNNDIKYLVYNLMSKISMIEHKINLLELKLENAINNKSFNREDYDE